MANSPAVSVVVPVFNAEAFLRASIDAILSQHFRDFELVIVNDGSTDESPAILNSLQDNRIRLVHQQNAGQSAAINRGVRESRGQFLKIVDADDWINPQHLQAQLRSLNDAPRCVSACRWGYFREDFRTPDVRTERADRNYDDPLEWIVDSLTLDEGMMGGWKWLIPREVWDRAGGYDERLSLNNDFHASIAILLASNGVRIAPEAVYSYRKGASNALSGSRSRKAMQSALLTTQLGCQLLLQRENSSRIRSLCAARYQRWAIDLFPEHRDLSREAELAAYQLGGAVVPFPGGVSGRLLSQVIGWRNVRRCQQFARSFGWGYVQSMKRWWRMRRMA